MPGPEVGVTPARGGDATAPISPWNRRDFLLCLGSLVAFCAAAGAVGCGGSAGSSPGDVTGDVTGVQSSLEVPVTWPIAAVVYTTAERQIFPLELDAGTAPVLPRDVQDYARYGYSSWREGPGTTYPGDPSSNPNPKPNPDNPAHDLRTDLVPAYAGTNAARFLHFFTMSDIHLTDKESPAQGLYIGWTTLFCPPLPGCFNITYWSPVIIGTVHVLDAAVQTVNALHRRLPFDFGMSMGDDCNLCQHNELRWFIDTLDGKVIIPSSGAHVGSATVDYQKPFRAQGLHAEIPWYQVIGNHDQFWLAQGYETAKSVAAHVGSDVIDLNPANPGQASLTGAYMGVVDGSTPDGTVIGYGLDTQISQPTVAPDPNRRTLESHGTAADGTVTVTSTTLNYMTEFFDTTTLPVGHGFTQANLEADVAYYTFRPKASLPITVIVLNDCPQVSNARSYAAGSLDATQYLWLQQQLAEGQASDRLMIIASHVPLIPQNSITDPTATIPTYTDWDPTSFVTARQVQALIWDHPNCFLWLAGHRHLNVITPQVPPPGQYLSPGFWEVETSSLRDHPQGFRAIEIRRNSDNTLSILVTTVNPAVVPGTPAGMSRDLSIGIARTIGLYPFTGPGSTASQAYNAELVAPLTPRMQAIVANLGVPLV